MALTFGRWVAIFAVGACAITAAVIGVRASDTNPFYDYYYYYYSYDASQSLENRARSLANSVAILERRDSLAARWRQGGTRPDLELAFGSSITASERHFLDSVARAFWREELHGPARAPTVLVIARENLAAYRGVKVDRSLKHILLPSAADGNTCAIFLPADPYLLSRALSGYAQESSLRGILESSAGPCVWFAKYGLPGSAFGGWLAQRDYSPALSVQARPPSDPLHADRARTTAGAVAGPWFSSSITVPAAACLAGESAQCDSTWTVRKNGGPRSRLLPRGFVLTGWSGPESGPASVLSRRFVARLEAELGPEKFARLWSSNEPLDRAFAGVAGASLTEVTRRMLLADNGSLTATPWPTAFEWLLNLALIALGLAWLRFVAQRWRAASA